MARKETLATWAGIGAALVLAGTATGFAMAAGRDAPPAPEPPHMGAEHGPGAMMPGMWPPMMMAHMAQRLGLTAEQKLAIHKSMDDARPGLEALHQQMRQDFELLARTRPDDATYQGVVASASQSASQNASQFVLQASQLRSRIYGVLTPTQRDQLMKLEAEHRAMHGADAKAQRGEGRHFGHHPPDAPPDAAR